MSLLLDMPMQDDAASATVVDESEYENVGDLNSGTSADISVAGPGVELLKALNLTAGKQIALTSATLPARSFSFALDLVTPDGTYPKVLGDTFNNNYFSFYTAVEGIELVCYIEANIFGTYAYWTLPEVPVGFHHYGVSLDDDGDIHFYYDGVEIVNELNDPGTVPSETTFDVIGDDTNAIGAIAGLRIYSQARTLEQIQADAAEGGLWASAAEGPDCSLPVRIVLSGGIPVRVVEEGELSPDVSIPVRVVEEGELSPDVSIPVRGLP